MKWIFTLALLAFTATAQLPLTPRVLIVVGDENYPTVTDKYGGTNRLIGLTGVAPNIGDYRSMTIWEESPTSKLLLFNLELINVGGRNWSPASIAPFSIGEDPDFGLPTLEGFLHMTLMTTNGVLVAEETRDLAFFAWDVYKVLPAARQSFDWGMPGISRSCAAAGWLPRWCGTYLNIVGVPSGRYVFRVEIDPVGTFGQFDGVNVGIDLNGTDLKFWQ